MAAKEIEKRGRPARGPSRVVVEPDKITAPGRGVTERIVATTQIAGSDLPASIIDNQVVEFHADFYQLIFQRGSVHAQT
jgi:hypothetical protein